MATTIVGQIIKSEFSSSGVIDWMSSIHGPSISHMKPLLVKILMATINCRHNNVEAGNDTVGTSKDAMEWFLHLMANSRW